MAVSAGFVVVNRPQAVGNVFLFFESGLIIGKVPSRCRGKAVALACGDAWWNIGCRTAGGCTEASHRFCSRLTEDARQDAKNGDRRDDTEDHSEDSKPL